MKIGERRTEWILVASREEARIFSRTGVGPLSLIHDLGNPLGTAKTQELESDKPGRSTDNRMRARHAYSTEESAKDRAIRNFYREVLDLVERGHLDHNFDYLTLAAEPKLLGIIRALLSNDLRRTVNREIAKDLSFEVAPEILARLSRE